MSETKDAPKPCPFCNAPNPWLTGGHGYKCPRCGGYAPKGESWNTRPIEDALLSQLRALLEACKAEAAVDQHWRECPECPDDGECCEVQTKLIANARLLRASALAAAEKGGE